MKLQPLPPLPKNVKYALTVPQSVLFADLSLQGNKRDIFRQAMQINYEPKYVVIDAGGAMSWNYDKDESFNKAFLQNRSIEEAVSHFVESMGTTGRKLARRMHLGDMKIRRSGNSKDIIEDLQEYWKAYRLHMASLFVFWNVQTLLSQSIKETLQRHRLTHKYESIESFIEPAETNQFVRERRFFEKIVQRLAPSTRNLTRKTAPKALMDALNHHAREFRFLLTPFNLEASTSGATLLPRVIEFQKKPPLPQTADYNDSTINAPDEVKNLLLLVKKLAFWKNERLDIFSLADASVEPLYKQAADLLSLPLDDLFAMTSDEIIASLRKKKPIISSSLIMQRKKVYCLALINGTIRFYTPSISTIYADKPLTKTTIINGACASVGKVSGKVRCITSSKDFSKLKKGEILVTKMTRPEYGVALDRAAAFVTDEGGLMSHAAIISREMKKPCIVGTQNATRILKDGDLVEVDAERGIVKILKITRS